MLLLQSYAVMSTSLSEGIHSLSRKIPNRDPEERCVTQRTRARVSNTTFVFALLIAERCFTSSALKLSCSGTRRRNHKPSQHVDIFSQGQCASTWVLTTPRWFSWLNTPMAKSVAIASVTHMVLPVIFRVRDYKCSVWARFIKVNPKYHSARSHRRPTRIRMLRSARKNPNSGGERARKTGLTIE